MEKKEKSRWDLWKKEYVKKYIMPKTGVDLQEVCLAAKEPLEAYCYGECPEDWALYTFEYLRASFFSENFQVKNQEDRKESVFFYVDLLNQLFQRERLELAFDPLRDFALLSGEEEKTTRILLEYQKMKKCFDEEGVYAFMRLSAICTPYKTLGHIAGVHHVAMYMARQLRNTKVPIDLGLMSGAALMHDIGKFGCRPEEGRRVPYLHYYYTYQYCSSKELQMIGDIASNHSVWDLELENLSTESLLLIYADFRVKSVYDENHQEKICFWSLDDSYQVILDKLDNVDEAKRKRYSRVYARLKDFEDYLISLGCRTDLMSGFGTAEREAYGELMTPGELIQKLKKMAIQSNLLIMKDAIQEEKFIELLETIRSQRDSRQVRAYLTVIEEYSDYLPQNQKKIILDFLLNMMAHMDGDIRRQAAGIAGMLLAKIEVCFTKEIPNGMSAPVIGESQESFFSYFMEKLLDFDIQTSEQERRHAGYALKVLLQTFLEMSEKKKRSSIIEIYLKQCYREIDSLTAFFLLDAAAEIKMEHCNEEQNQKLEMFAARYLSGYGSENLVAALRFLLLRMQQGYLCRPELKQILDTMILTITKQPYCVQFLVARMREFYGVASQSGIQYYDLTKLYLENQRAEVPWIYKFVNLEVLRQRQGVNQNPEQLYQYASHLLNLLQFSGRIVNRMQAGENLLEILPILPQTQKYEIVLELVRALEIGEYAVSKYIPPYLGKIYYLLEENEQEYVLEQLEYQMQSREIRTNLAVLETVGAILKSAVEIKEDEKIRRLIGILCIGMASDDREVAQEAFYVSGHELFSEKTLDGRQKASYFRMLARKMVTLLNWDKLGVFYYYNGAALNHIYRFIDDYQSDYQQLPLKEEKKPVAFFPGSFDPFSLGHKQIVNKIREMGYRVYLAVDEFSWSKRTQPFEVRRRILALSVADLTDVFLFPEEIPVNIANPEDLYMLQQYFHGEKPSIVAGSDVILNASAYQKEIEEHSIHTFPHLIFYRNQGMSEETENKIRESMQGKLPAKCQFMQISTLYEEVSSTKIRKNVNEGKDISGLVEAGVQNYIYRQGLYSLDSAYKRTAVFKPVEIQIMEKEQQICFCLFNQEIEQAYAEFHEIQSGNYYQEFGNLETAKKIREVISGKTARIDVLQGQFSENDDYRLTILNEVLEYLQERNYSYAICRPEADHIPLLRLHGFVPVKGASEFYYVDLCSPFVVFYDTLSIFKESIARVQEVRKQIRISHLRLLEKISELYPGRLILCFESEYLNYRLLKWITQENKVPFEQRSDRKNGEKMCVPFGKILKGVRVPNTVTKELETEKLYQKDLSDFVITQYQGFAPLEVQIRTIHSFARPVILVDDLYHTGNRMKELTGHLKIERIKDYELLVGVLSGQGEDLAREQKLKTHAIYKVPNLRSWMIESDLYPFLGGDGVETNEEQAIFSGIIPSVNPILPYAFPGFIEGAEEKGLFALSKICMENARGIYQAVEKEYRFQYGRRMTIERMGEILAQPRYPDSIRLNKEICGQTPSQILEEEIEKLNRFHR